MKNRTLISGIGFLCLASALVGCGQTTIAKAKSREYEEAKGRYLAAGWPFESNLFGAEINPFSVGEDKPIARVPNVLERKPRVRFAGADLEMALLWVKESEKAIEQNMADIRSRIADKTKGPSGAEFPDRAQEKAMVKALMLRAEIMATSGQSARALEDLNAAAEIAHWQLVDYKDSIGYMVGAASFSIFAGELQRFPVGAIKQSKIAELAAKLDSTTNLKTLLKESAAYSLDLVRFEEIESGKVKYPPDLDKLPAELVTEQGQNDAIVMMNIWMKISKILDKHGKETRLIKEELTPILAEMGRLKLRDSSALTDQIKQVESMCEGQMKVKASTKVFHAAALLATLPKGSSLDALPRGDWSDPFTGNPLIVKWNGDNVTVQSVGPNGKDDGAETGKSDDIRYTLARNQAK